MRISAGVDTIVADPHRLGRALANLVSNAVKFSPDGGQITIEAARNDGVVAVAVRDSGPVFDEFQQAAPAGLAIPGTGLGLALARTFVELHDGRLEVESEPGRGSTFQLALPQAARVPSSG